MVRDKIGLFLVRNVKEFKGYTDFQVKQKLFLSYSKAYDYVLDAFKARGVCFDWKSKWHFCYEWEDYGCTTSGNYIEIHMVLPFYVSIGREWF